MKLVLTALLIVGIWFAPSVAATVCDSCVPCHGNLENYHGDFSHSAAPPDSIVTIFPKSGHDNSQTYFTISVECAICHNTELPVIHGDDCATCHPTPYDTLGTWGSGCQQGGCHPFYHQDSTKGISHAPWANTSDPANNCSICHELDMSVPQSNCAKCHEVYDPNDVIPPVTTSNAKANYDLPAKIDFSIRDNGKVGIGRTFYRLDNGEVTAAGKSLTVSAPGPHELEFWSKDQAGNTESAPNFAFFTITPDTTPPVTTSNAMPSYDKTAVITLTATDAGPGGVKRTSYKINNGTVVTGTNLVVTINATGQTSAYTLTFWSEDWAGNIETPKVTNFTITGDVTPPVTTSNAQSFYYQGATITLTATDGGSQGVKATYSQLFTGSAPGPILPGTKIVIPPTSGTKSYTLKFWSEDWSNNVEIPKSVDFVVSSGSATFKLVWGNSDVTGSPCFNNPDASADWRITRGGFAGSLVASGSAACPNWSGINYEGVLVGPQLYFVSVNWWDSEAEFDDNTSFPNISVTTPGQVIRIAY